MKEENGKGWTYKDKNQKSELLEVKCPQCKEHCLMQAVDVPRAMWCSGFYCNYGLSHSGKLLNKNNE
jgi:hypothetical protein